MASEDDDYEDDAEQLMTDAHAEADMAPCSDNLGEMLLSLIGQATQVMALLLECDEIEFAQNAQRLQLLFSLINQFPERAVRASAKPRVVGFQAPAKKKKRKALRRKARE